ncbi:tRNA(Ile)-lysidine synthase [Acinetobacter calcoaceticus]|uniref:tRNA(Ile)-lysidine synthase n=1 Tax=Acinetobacter calcoaceticus TaxID=471 RepID=A0A4R1XR16_ACICA|nr:tRNA(Ile)-lysidine synthase [Acinetobacter calcoaceticus]
MDSMLLLFLMAQLCPQHIRVIYINHQLQQGSEQWGDLVQQQCAILNIPCIVEAVDVAAGNLEQQARAARYQAYQKHIQSHEVLVLGHHQQDQAETVMLRLLSGAGVSGLSAMKRIDSRDGYQVWRPLLELSREQICQWAEQMQLQYVNDPSNADIHYDRAWCREQLWPVLQQRYPKMQVAINRSSELMQDADQILQEVVQLDLSHCGNHQQLHLTALAELSEARRRQLLSVWMKGDAQYRPAFDMIQRLQDEVIAAKSDAQAALHSNGYYFVRYQQVLYRLEKQFYLAHKQVLDLQPTCLSIDRRSPVQLDAGLFEVRQVATGLAWDLLEQKLDLQRRMGGEKIHLYGRVGAWPLKKALQQAQIFPWLRHTIQILSIDNVMLGVFTPKGFWLAQSDYCVTDGWLPNLISP